MQPWLKCLPNVAISADTLKIKTGQQSFFQHPRISRHRTSANNGYNAGFQDAVKSLSRAAVFSFPRHPGSIDVPELSRTPGLTVSRYHSSLTKVQSRCSFGQKDSSGIKMVTAATGPYGKVEGPSIVGYALGCCGLWPGASAHEQGLKAATEIPSPLLDRS